MDRKIRELTEELDSANRKSEFYRVNLFSVLQNIEQHKQELSLKVENIKLSLRNGM